MNTSAFRAALLVAALAGVWLGTVAPLGAADSALSLRLGYCSLYGDGREAAAENIAAALGLGGRVKIQIVPMDNPRSLFRELRTGALDMALLDAWALGEAVPSLRFLAMPFIFGVENKTRRFFDSAGYERINELLQPEGLSVVRWFRLESPVLIGGVVHDSRESLDGITITGLENPVMQGFADSVGASFQTIERGRLLAGTFGRNAAAVATLSDIAGARLPAGNFSLTEFTAYEPYIAVCLAASRQADLDRATEGAYGDMIASAVERVEREKAHAAAEAQRVLTEAGHTLSRLETGGEEDNPAAPARGQEPWSGDTVLREALQEANRHDVYF